MKNKLPFIIILAFVLLLICAQNIATYGGKPPGSKPEPGTNIPKCEGDKDHNLSLFPFYLNYNENSLTSQDKQDLIFRHFTYRSPMDINQLFHNQYSSNPKENSSLKITISSSQCYGSIVTEFNKKSDFPNGYTSTIIDVKYSDILYYPTAKVEAYSTLFSTLVDGKYRKRLVWSKTAADTNHFVEFNVTASILPFSIFALTKLTRVDGGSDYNPDYGGNSCDGACENWWNDDVYQDGEYNDNSMIDMPAPSCDCARL